MRRLATALLIGSVLPLAACDRAASTALASSPPANRSMADTTAELHRLVNAMHHHPAEASAAAKGKPIKVSTVIVPKAAEHGAHHH
jgi:hypothetical protein